MAKHMLRPLTALGHDMPEVITIGGYRITERFDVALASLASRRGREKDVAKHAKDSKASAGRTCSICHGKKFQFVLALHRAVDDRS